MDVTQILTYGGLILVIIVIGVAARMLRVSLTKKVLDATQKDRPKSKLQKFLDGVNRRAYSETCLEWL